LHAREDDLKYLLLSTLALIALGCSSREVLDPLPAKSSVAVDFSGNWKLLSDSAAERRIIDAAINDAVRGRRSRRGSSSKSSGGLVQVFLETGEALKVTQTSEGMFLSFDRSIVEEYRFGENRMISVGAITAQRVSGWDGEQYVVQSLDKKGMRLIERLWLADGGDILHRQFVFRDDKNKEVVAEQRYQRVVK
jgi:hypothetical protein